MTIHSFKASLRSSHKYADAQWWGAVYRIAFPNLATMSCVREDGWAQRGGIDRVLTLTNGRTLYVDEKVRMRDWPDILLERWSDKQRRIPGWAQKDLACDFIAYAFVPSQRCYLLPFQTLRQAWRRYGRKWVKLYRPVLAENVGYVTESVPVPIPELMKALTDAMIIEWK